MPSLLTNRCACVMTSSMQSASFFLFALLLGHCRPIVGHHALPPSHIFMFITFLWGTVVNNALSCHSKRVGEALHSKRDSSKTGVWNICKLPDTVWQSLSVGYKQPSPGDKQPITQVCQLNKKYKTPLEIAYAPIIKFAVSCYVASSK